MLTVSSRAFRAGEGTSVAAPFPSPKPTEAILLKPLGISGLSQKSRPPKPFELSHLISEDYISKMAGFQQEDGYASLLAHQADGWLAFGIRLRRQGYWAPTFRQKRRYPCISFAGQSVKFERGSPVRTPGGRAVESPSWYIEDKGLTRIDGLQASLAPGRLGGIPGPIFVRGLSVAVYAAGLTNPVVCDTRDRRSWQKGSRIVEP